jgi:Flp pilus assembly pilin Flp
MTRTHLARLAAALRWLRRTEGQTMTEYAVVLTLIAIALVATIGTLRDAIITVISNAAGAI